MFYVPHNHPSWPGRGVRAKHDLKAGVALGYYAGYLRDARFVADNPYVFGVEDDRVIDAQLTGNITRYINDPRRMNKPPNVETITEVYELRGTKLPGILFKTIVDIAKGDELLLRYEASVKGYWG